MASQSLLRLFQAKKPAFGAWLSLPSSFVARTVAQASPHLSWMIIDCEHGLISLVPGAAEAVTAIQGAVPNGGPTPIVRIPATGISTSSSWQIKHALDSGARGVLVPLVRKKPSYHRTQHNLICLKKILRYLLLRKPRRLLLIADSLQSEDEDLEVHSHTGYGE
jgi:2-keto-3-deoxy-L-rhamnonate aldolase RhmA